MLRVAALSLYVNASPFLVTWNIIHAVLAPAAGHSGYEDHWQSDQFHHLHHQYFECNYGNIGFPFDKWFGTIRHHIGDSKDYVGEGFSSSKKNDGDTVASKGPSLKYLRGGLTLRGALPNRADHLAYWVFTISLAFVFGYAVCLCPGHTVGFSQLLMFVGLLCLDLALRGVQLIGSLPMWLSISHWVLHAWRCFVDLPCETNAHQGGLFIKRALLDRSVGICACAWQQLCFRLITQ